MWQCPKCKREFIKTNQSHSCREGIPIEKHFLGREKSRELFEDLKYKIEKGVGPFTIDSPACCIHFVNRTTFCACWALKDKIRIDFSLNREEVLKRALKVTKLSANRFIYYVDITTKSEIDAELLALIKESYNLK